MRLISALPVTPEVGAGPDPGHAAVLTIGLDDITSAQVVAAILVFRAVTYLLPIPLGLTSYAIWRVNKSWKMSEEQRAALAGDAYDYESEAIAETGGA